MSAKALYSSDDMKYVGNSINENINCGIDIIERVSHHVIDSGGKRIRPAVLLAAHKTMGGKDAIAAIPLAVAVELIHTGTLIHDDINDRSAVRRGMPTAHTKFGTSAALLTGDYLFVKAYELLSQYEKDIRDTITTACLSVAVGEIIQSQNITNIHLTEDDYLGIIEKKTASPISASSKAGGMIAGGSPKHHDFLEEYGMNLGTGFQIMDDILDVVGTHERTGKPLGNDLSEGKMTILSIHALDNVGNSQYKFLKEVILHEHNNMEDILEAIDIMKEAGSIDYARDLSMSYGERAKAILEEIPRTGDWEKLLQMADFAVDRNH